MQAVVAAGKIIGVEAYGPRRQSMRQAMRQAMLGLVERLYPKLKTRIDVHNVAVAGKPDTANLNFDRSLPVYPASRSATSCVDMTSKR